MKKIFFAILLTCLSAHCFAQQNYFITWLSGGTSMTLDDLSWTTTKFGGGGTIGLGYQWQKNLFIVNIGFEASFQDRNIGLNDTTFRSRIVDSEHESFIYNGEVINRNDQLLALDANIPIMLGVQTDNFYFLAGVKLSVNGIGWTRQRGYFSTQGDYDRFYETLTDMPNHNFHTYELVKTSSTRWLNTELLGSLELGAVAAIVPEKFRIKVGFFADLGIIQFGTRSGLNSIAQPNPSDPFVIDLTHVYFSREGCDAKLHNLNAGMKVTFEILPNHKGKCVVCEWNHWRY